MNKEKLESVEKETKKKTKSEVNKEKKKKEG